MRRFFFLILPWAAIVAAQDYNAEIRPLLAKRCFGCHSDAARTSGLSLQSKAAIALGGNRGPAQAHILAAVRRAGDLKMPPSGPLPANEVALLERWVNAGFPGLPETSAGPAAPKHWAFAKPVRQPSRTIDQFIRERLA